MPQGAAGASSLIWIILLFAIMYFLMIRPQQQQQKRRREMLSKLKKGDRIVTVGGIHATITDVREDELTIRIADKVEVELSKSGVGYVKGKDKEKEGE
ncbi:MAG TPA: preprotein translocase subunit YajC [Clostridia bacterium]|nr:preprotein translocase subunit YajC [Clostridia bacterium]